MYVCVFSDYISSLSEQRLVSLTEARRLRFRLEESDYVPTTPSFIGRKRVDMSLRELVPYIDWSPFFQVRGCLLPSLIILALQGLSLYGCVFVCLRV